MSRLLDKVSSKPYIFQCCPRGDKSARWNSFQYDCKTSAYYRRPGSQRSAVRTPTPATSKHMQHLCLQAHKHQSAQVGTSFAQKTLCFVAFGISGGWVVVVRGSQRSSREWVYPNSCSQGRLRREHEKLAEELQQASGFGCGVSGCKTLRRFRIPRIRHSSISEAACPPEKPTTQTPPDTHDGEDCTVLSPSVAELQTVSQDPNSRAGARLL